MTAGGRSRPQSRSPLKSPCGETPPRNAAAFSGRRQRLSVSLEDLRASNPAFPVGKVFQELRRKAGGNVGDRSSPGGKRKHQDEQDVPDEARKKPRSGSPSGEVRDTDHRHPSGEVVRGCGRLAEGQQLGRSRLSRTHRLKRQKRTGDQSSSPRPTSRRESEGQSVMSSCRIQRDSRVEDVLWTEKYSPQRPSEVIGNSTAMNKLHSWLKKWKLRTDCDERRKEVERKHEENSSDSWDCGDFQGEAASEEETGQLLSNTMLITGPPGVGKTAAVYACTLELGFKVFEVNSSSRRSGPSVLSQLKEATQSHLVKASERDQLKPAYFSNYAHSRTCLLPGKMTSTKSVTSTSRRRPESKAKLNPATVTLANFFKAKAKADNMLCSGPPPEKPGSKKLCHVPETDQKDSQSKKTATSLILFEEVDVIFEDDVGFLATIKTFMKTTKRPVVLTTSDPLFKERFDGNLEEIIFKTPPVVNMCSYLHLVCLVENVMAESNDVTSLLTLSQADVRRCLLQLQFWAQSGAWQSPQRGAQPKIPTGSNDIRVEDNLNCDTGGCTATMLGLHTVNKLNILNLLKLQSWTDQDNVLLKHLTECWRRSVPLLYSNLELLLPLPTDGKENTDYHPDKGLNSGPTPPEVPPQIQPVEENIDLKAATNINSKRNFSRLSRRKCLLKTPGCRSTAPLLAGSHFRSQRSEHTTKGKETSPPTHAFCTLSDFFDLMSYLDTTAPTTETHISGACSPEDFLWTGAEVKDGLLDQTRDEGERSRGQERSWEIQAAAEGLGFQRCYRTLSWVWTEPQEAQEEPAGVKRGELTERLPLPNLTHRQSFSLSSQPLCKPSVVQKRFELSRAVLQNRSFSLLGNRRAVCVDYMPFLRSVCRYDREQQKANKPGGCRKGFSSINLGMSKSTVQLLAEDFSAPQNGHESYSLVPALPQ